MKSFFVSLLFVSAILLAGCGGKTGSEDEEGGGNVKATVAVKVVPLRRGDMKVAVQATGKTDAIRKEKLSSPVAGKVVSLKALVGASVQAGEVLAVIRTKESQEAISGAEALLRSAGTTEQRNEAQRTLELAKSSENTLPIRATFSGTVSSRAVSEGDLVAENGELFTIIDLSTLVFVADVPVRDLPSLAIGQRSTVILQTIPEKGLPAEVEAISPQTDVMSQTVKVRLGFLPMPDASRRLLKTDMIGEARITTGVHKGVFLVPRQALLRNDETNACSVVTFTPDSLALTLPVEVGGTTDSTAEISNHALKEGMNIITEGHYALADSTRITVVR
jgi:multidrug efflux pump subunit AcrA (membrane-fusion protein)